MAKDKYIEIKGARANNLKTSMSRYLRANLLPSRVSLAPVSHRWLSTHSMPKVSAVMWNPYLHTPDSFWVE